jgi:hypothetical protein
LILALGACGGGGTDPDDDIDGFDGFTAKIDGELWKASAAVTAVNNIPGRYFINAARTSGSNNYTIRITLLNIPGPGTYPLGVESSMFGGYAEVVKPAPGGDDWDTPMSGAAGVFVITTLTATRMVGTFEFVAEGTGTRTVTEGAFDIAVNQTGGVAAANMGSSFTASVGGTFNVFNLAQQVVAGDLLIVAYSPDGQITIAIQALTVTGTYPTSTSIPIRTISLGTTAGGWSTQHTGGSGSVILTVTADRFSGTFTANVRQPGGANPRTISGTFSIGRAAP